jgi:transcriptional regulator
MLGIVLHLGNKMANRRKDERNKKILALWNKGWRQKSIARMFKMTESAVQMTIARAKATPAKAEIQEGAV